MFDTLVTFVKNILKTRTVPLILIYLCFSVILVYKVFTIQVVRQEELTKDTVTQEVVTRETKATRGNIYDCNGVLLAYNKLSYSVTLQDYKVFETDEEKNAMLYKLVKIIEAYGGTLYPDFYIEKDENGQLKFTVSGAAESRFKRDAYKSTSVDKLTPEQKNATAKEVFEHLRHGKFMFDISDKYSVDDALKIMKVRFALLLNTYNRGNPISIAVNVNERVVAAILENSSELPGVEIAEHTYRYYNDSKYFAHVLGYTGSVNENEMSADKEKYYNSTDQIGKTGIEYSFEKYLRGSKGSEEATLNSKYYVTGVKTISEPKAGDDVYLTIDSKLQKACYNIIERELATVLLSKIHNSASYGGRGKNAYNIMIPIYEVYNALFDNGVVNLARLETKKAGKVEKVVYAKYKSEEKTVLEKLRKLMEKNSVSEEHNDKTTSEYIDYLYSYIKNEELIDVTLVNEDDEIFKSYVAGKKSLGDFLKYAISNRWINLPKLNIGEEYLSTEEIYKILLKYLFDNISSDVQFKKIIYKNLIFDQKISGTEVCVILFSQGFLKKDDTSYRNLLNGTLSPYTFIRSKIKKLEITPANLALDPCSGSMVITDPNNGEVKALVTYPSYDNNKLANQIDAKYYAKLQADKSYPLINRPCQQKTAPGSTFKMVSTAADLGTGVITDHEKIYADVVFTKTDKPASCWSKIPHGNIDVRTAIEVSCNYFFYETGYRMSLDADGKYNSKLGLDKLNKYAAMFGFKKGVTSGVELYEYEPSISDTDSVRSSIGQGSYAFTPTQIARYVSAIANAGTLHYLTVVKEIKSLAGNEIKNTVSNAVTKKAPKINLSQNIWSAIKDGMYLAVNGSKSSHKDLFKDIKVKIAGKTGTAQFSTMRGDHALFTSYAPYDKPKISVTCVLPYAYTSGNAARAVADFYEYYFGDGDEETLNKKSVKDNVTDIISD